MLHSLEARPLAVLDTQEAVSEKTSVPAFPTLAQKYCAQTSNTAAIANNVILTVDNTLW